MRKATSQLVFLVYALGASAFAGDATGPTADADHWHNRPNVINAAARLATEIEHLDESLHNVHAPTHFIQKVHHTEETVTEFVQMVRSGVAYHEAKSEFDHIRQDMQLITNEFNQHSHLLADPKVASEWRFARSAYRRLDHEMFRRPRPTLPLDQLDRELQKLEAHQAELVK